MNIETVSPSISGDFFFFAQHCEYYVHYIFIMCCFIVNVDQAVEQNNDCDYLTCIS